MQDQDNVFYLFNPLLMGLFWFQIVETPGYFICKRITSGFSPAVAAAKRYVPDHLAHRPEGQP